MGAVDFLPYAHSKNGAPIALWDGGGAVVDHITGSNVMCELQRPNGLWYKVSTEADIDAGRPSPGPTSASGRYVSAALVELTPGPPGYRWGACPANDDQPGLRLRDRAVLVTRSAAVLAALVAAGLVVGRRLRAR